MVTVFEKEMNPEFNPDKSRNNLKPDMQNSIIVFKLINTTHGKHTMMEIRLSVLKPWKLIELVIITLLLVIQLEMLFEAEITIQLLVLEQMQGVSMGGRLSKFITSLVLGGGEGQGVGRGRNRAGEHVLVGAR